MKSRAETSADIASGVLSRQLTRSTSSVDMAAAIGALSQGIALRSIGMTGHRCLLFTVRGIEVETRVLEHTVTFKATVFVAIM